MHQYLGPRGKLIAAGVTLFSIAAAAYAGVTGDPVGVAVCLLLGYVGLLLTVLWGMVKQTSKSLLRASREASKGLASVAQAHRQGGAPPAPVAPASTEPAPSLRAMVELLIRDKVALRADEERLAAQISELTDLLTRLEVRMAPTPETVGSNPASTPATSSAAQR